MPKMNGWEAFNRIRGISLLKNVPIVFLTSVDEKEEEKKGIRMGAADYIVKPFNSKELIERIESILGKTDERK
jgi:DNA-binding response OmpR family regulator